MTPDERREAWLDAHWRGNPNVRGAEPCAREHDPGKLCILTDGHDPDVTKRPEGEQQPLHHPTPYRTSRYGCWGVCRCGWESAVLSNVMSVHLAFGLHLVGST